MVERGWPERLRSDLVRELVHGHTKLLKSCPCFVESSFAAMLCFIPGGHIDVGVAVRKIKEKEVDRVIVEMYLESRAERGAVYACSRYILPSGRTSKVAQLNHV